MIHTVLRFFKYVKGFIVDKEFKAGFKSSLNEAKKSPERTNVINFLLEKTSGLNYLEIGVRNPNDNFNKINAKNKYSVDPGVEFKENPVDFKMTSDEFFNQLEKNEILDSNILFDVIFIDGLHLADQAYRDVENSLKYMKPNGFIVMHDCNPPTEWHQRESYDFVFTPAEKYWSGTTWKAFVRYRSLNGENTCCVDSDWGVGIISKEIKLGEPTKTKNDFFEYQNFANNRKDQLNLISFDELKQKFVI